jgi:hypothetical protein
LGELRGLLLVLPLIRILLETLPVLLLEVKCIQLLVVEELVVESSPYLQFPAFGFLLGMLFFGLGLAVSIDVVACRGFIAGTNVDENWIGFLLAFAILAEIVEVKYFSLSVEMLIVSGERHAIEVKSLLERIELLLDLLGLLEGLLNDFVDVGSYVFIFLVAGVDDFLGSMLDHVEDFISSNFVLIFLVSVRVELASLHNQVVHFQFLGCSLHNFLFN